MATEQDWAAYADQSTLNATDTILARTAAGAGVEVPGSALVRLDGSGNVGIGTAAPSFRLDVHDSAANTVRSYCTDATSASYAAVSAGTASGVNSVMYSFSGASWYGTTTNHPVVFLTNNSERMRIDSSGNVGIGTSSPGTNLDVANTSRFRVDVNSAYTLLTSLNSSGAAFVDAFTNALSHTWQTSGVGRMSIDSAGFVSISGVQLTVNAGRGLFQHDGTNMFVRPINAGSQMYVGANNINVGVFENGGFKAAADNTFYMGAAGSRWTVVFAATGTINTSDERDKVWRGGPTEAELRAARRIIAELGFYQWADAVAEKGDDARLHFGVKAQQVWRIMAEEGLVDPISEAGLPGSTPYAFLCFDQWDAEPDAPAVEEVLDDDGNVIAAAMPARPGIEAGNRFGLRVDQLALFLIAAQNARIAALETAPLT